MAGELAPDWILQQALATQQQAHTAFVRDRKELTVDDGCLTLTVLGCGTMGVAILRGIMDSLKPDQPFSTKTSTPTPARLPSKFNACVTRPESAERVKSELGKYNANLAVYDDNHLGAVRYGDVVLLCCKPCKLGEVLGAQGMREALTGKLLISILGGVTEAQIHDALYSNDASDGEKCRIVRAMPNAAAAVRESMTVIEIPNPPLSAESDSILTWIFTRIGKVTQVPPAMMDASIAVCAAGPAFCAMIVESMAAGAIAGGIPREEAYKMAAQTMRGTTGLLLQGEHPAVLRDRVATPGGATIAGLQVLEEGSVRGTVAKAVREATVVASQLGHDKHSLNGTR